MVGRCSIGNRMETNHGETNVIGATCFSVFTIRFTVRHLLAVPLTLALAYSLQYSSFSPAYLHSLAFFRMFSSYHWIRYTLYFYDREKLGCPIKLDEQVETTTTILIPGVCITEERNKRYMRGEIERKRKELINIHTRIDIHRYIHTHTYACIDVKENKRNISEYFHFTH